MAPEEKRFYDAIMQEYREWRATSPHEPGTKWVRYGAMLALSQLLNKLGWIRQARGDLAQRETADLENGAAARRDELVGELYTMLDIGLDKKSARRLAEIIEELAKLTIRPV